MSLERGLCCKITRIPACPELAEPNRENIVNVRLDDFDLEQLIGNLSLEANHNKKRSIKEFACEMAEKLETYQYQLKKIAT